MVLVVDGLDALDDKRNMGYKPDYHERHKETRRGNIEAFYQSLLPNSIANEWIGPDLDPATYDGLYGWSSSETREKFISYNHDQNHEESKRAQVARKDKKRSILQKAEAVYRSDIKYRRLYDLVVDYFAIGLKGDLQRMDNGD